MGDESGQQHPVGDHSDEEDGDGEDDGESDVEGDGEFNRGSSSLEFLQPLPTASGSDIQDSQTATSTGRGKPNFSARHTTRGSLEDQMAHQ